MKVFVTGGTGFVGRAVCQELVKAGHYAHCLIRPGSEHRLIASPQIKSCVADLFSPVDLTPLIEDCDAVIHLIGIIREDRIKGVTFDKLHTEATASIIEATCKAGVNRYFHMSANGTRENAVSRYHQTKWLAEECVRNSGLDWTIFRPSLIYGPEDQFINMLSGLLRRLPVHPVMGTGEYKMQPVPVNLIAASFVDALTNNSSLHKTYHCGGLDCLSYIQLIDQVGDALGIKKVRKLYQPLALMRPMISIFQHLPFFPMTSDQLQMLLEGNCCANDDWTEDFNIELSSFRDGLSYLHNK